MGLIFGRVSDETRRIDLGGRNEKYVGNKIDSSKYNLITFLPKSLILQFMRLSNLVFLLNAVLQSIPILSSVSPFTALGPLAFVLAISMLREGYEDYKRHKKDWEINSRTTRILKNGEFIEIEWDQLKVGDYVQIRSGEIIPADILLLSSSQENSICYVETSNLDGENNLKEKHCFTDSITLFPEEFQKLKGECCFQPPKPDLYEFQGEIQLQGKQAHAIGYQNLILRETVLKNTQVVVGVALYCGYDTKILKNQGQLHHKVSGMQRKLNYIQIWLMVLLLVLCSACALGYFITHKHYNLRLSNSYIPSVNLSLTIQSGLDLLTVFLLLNFLIPITLNMLIEGIKTFSGVFLSVDRKLYDKKLKKGCGVMNTSIIQELGFVDCVLTDKTGTLTANQMVFKTVAIQDRVYSREYIQQNIENLTFNKQFEQFWENLIICHDVVKDQHRQQYQGSSPDQVCFINFANSIGFTFIKRTKNSIEIIFQGQKRVYQLLEILPFSSRKRMSVFVRDPNRPDEVRIFTKGADTSIFEKAGWYDHSECFVNNIDVFAKDGLRTLVFAEKIISSTEYKKYLRKRQTIRNQIKHRLINKEQGVEMDLSLTEEIQNGLHIVGASGIEDRLQEEVPQTIARLQRAGIRVMMVTGDKLQTAQNIGYLAHMIKENYKVLRLTSATEDLHHQSQVILEEMNNHEQICLIIEGKQIGRMLDENNEYFLKIYADMLTKAKSVIFCRSSPKQKALIVKFVKKHMNAVVLAIGDGGNDVGMIQQAHIGVGIIGKEGNSASVVSDFSFGKFKFLDRLILHHGRWFSYRLSYFFAAFGLKNMVITWIIFYYAIQSAYSANFNYTQLYYAVFNAFIAISPLVCFGLAGQDINDDLEPKIWDYLPEIYKQNKLKDLFSYKRYMLWSIASIILALALYIVVRAVLSPLQSCDEFGRIPDFQTIKIANGIILTIILLLIYYLDTQTHSYFYEIVVFIFGAILPTAAYFICQNYMQFLSHYLIYTDNYNLRFWLTMFILVSGVFLFKVGYSTYCIDQNPTIIDCYKQVMHADNETIDKVMIKAVQNSVGFSKCEKEEEKIIENVTSMKDVMNTQWNLLRKCSSSSVDVTSDNFIFNQVHVNKSAIVRISTQSFV